MSALHIRWPKYWSFSFIINPFMPPSFKFIQTSPALGSLPPPQIRHSLSSSRLPEDSLRLALLECPPVSSRRWGDIYEQSLSHTYLLSSSDPQHQALQEERLSDPWCPEPTTEQTDRDCSMPFQDPIPGRRWLEPRPSAWTQPSSPPPVAVFVFLLPRQRLPRPF